MSARWWGCRFRLKKLLIILLPYSTGTLILVRGYLGCNMGSLWPLQELPGPGLHGKKLIAKKILFSHCDNLWKIGCQLFFLVVHMSPPRWGLHFLRLWYSWIWRRSARTPKTIKKKQSFVRWGSFHPGVPRCPQMKTSSYWRHMYNKVFIYEPQCHKMYIFSYFLYFFLGGGDAGACYV